MKMCLFCELVSECLTETQGSISVLHCQHIFVLGVVIPWHRKPWCGVRTISVTVYFIAMNNVLKFEDDPNDVLPPMAVENIVRKPDILISGERLEIRHVWSSNRSQTLSNFPIIRLWLKCYTLK